MGVIRNPIVLSAMGALEWASYHSAHRLIGLSPGIIKGITKRGIPIDRITLVPNVCDLNVFANNLIAWRPSEIDSNDLIAVYAGTHGMANGLDALLDVAAELKRRGRKDIKVLLIGNGKLKHTLQKRAQLEGLSNVVFHEPVNKEKLAGLLADADIGLQCLANVPEFYYGTSPNKFFDYIAAGLPVINNYPGWIAEIIIENQCGFTVPPNDFIAFADALEKAANNKSALKLMGRKSIELAESKFSRNMLANYWVDWVVGVKTN
jgi:glycosyltransferase involved in cell wall biosynthesis